ncbi:hypothetical protein [Halobacillus sp. BBL2006]|uniref:hypothetical protein n=1 Tax=Halobacillus sp. BBL2006 TaxID=1543706 RepID=UPI000542912A|nr:hypothetical protein [Halobacillus sp. BBL2006]KHE70066.1 hypothetical protein LD39_12030 [Halobacillus sp. BBL2006]
MNDLLDHKLKKLDKESKHKKVPFQKEHTYRAVLLGTLKQSHRQRWRMSLIIPLPLIALVAFFSMQFTDTHSRTPIYTASMQPEKSILAGSKTFDFHRELFVEKSLTSTEKSATMFTETYVIHDGKKYIQTGKRVDPESLNKVIGRVKNKDAPEKKTFSKGATFFPETEIYSIKGRKESEMIAIQSTRSTGIGSSSISTPGYFVFKKKEALPTAQ